MSRFALFTLVAWLAVIVTARVMRGRLYATFVGVMLGLHSLIAVGLWPLFEPVLPYFAALHATVYVHFLLLARPRMRPWLYRALISVPSAFFIAGTFLAFPWAILAAVGLRPPFAYIPYVLATLGVLESMFSRRGVVDVVVGDERVSELRPHRAPAHREERPLSIVQITDPHLGPFMSVKRLRRICERAVERDPDLIVLTGDFLTMESQSDPRHLHEALAPLRAAKGKVFACLGNHDHEALPIVRDALRAHGITLLVDDATTVTTPAGEVQIVGVDYHFRERSVRIPAVFAEHPRRDGALRLVLLHDPGAFHHVPEGEADLVLSGHTHGGQVGLVTLGAAWTFLRLFGTKMPDHGLWARGRDRLYVHRGTGHYGFPVRLGVPSEESLLRVHRIRC